MSVMSTALRRSARAASKPPNPAPMITARGRSPACIAKQPLGTLARLFRRPVALRLERHIVPLLPGLDSPGVLLARHRQSAGTEEDAQRRFRRIDDFQDGPAGRFRVARDIAAAQGRDGRARSVIRWNGCGALGGRATPFGCITARFNDGYLDAEAGNLGGQSLAEALQAPLRGVIQADGREC